MLVVWNIITYSFKRNYVNCIHTRMFIHFDGFKVIMISQLFGIEGIEDKNSDASTSSNMQIYEAPNSETFLLIHLYSCLMRLHVSYSIRNAYIRYTCI